MTVPAVQQAQENIIAVHGVHQRHVLPTYTGEAYSKAVCPGLADNSLCLQLTQ